MRSVEEQSAQCSFCGKVGRTPLAALGTRQHKKYIPRVDTTVQARRRPPRAVQPMRSSEQAGVRQHVHPARHQHTLRAVRLQAWLSVVREVSVACGFPVLFLVDRIDLLNANRVTNAKSCCTVQYLIVRGVIKSSFYESPFTPSL